ncbi:unnamed protein product, partial [Brassica rapa subsp. narinosa]
RDTQGNSVRINIEYPSLPPKCINCGKYGHLINRCHKPLTKRPQVQKKEKVVSIVKSGDELPLSALKQGEVTEVQGVDSKGVSNRARSRSRRRSQSRARARARALSSPPGGTEVGTTGTQLGEEPVVALEGLEEVSKSSEVKVLTMNMEEETVMEGISGLKEEVILEEGEILEVPEEIEDKSSKWRQEGSLETEEDDSVWFTKHSKNFRRAMRQQELWKASGAVGTPPKSSKFLTRGSSSGRKLR